MLMRRGRGRNGQSSCEEVHVRVGGRQRHLGGMTRSGGTGTNCNVTSITNWCATHELLVLLDLWHQTYCDHSASQSVGVLN